MSNQIILSYVLLIVSVIVVTLVITILNTKSIISKKTKKYIFLHVGRCGGGTITRSLIYTPWGAKNLHEIHFLHNKHISEFIDTEENKNLKIIVFVRDPISRFLSAYKWRYYETFFSDFGKFNDTTTEKKYLSKIAPNDFAERLFSGDEDIEIIKKFDHIEESHNAYLGGIEYMESKLKNRLLMIGCIKNYDKDYNKLLKLLNLKEEKYPMIKEHHNYHNSNFPSDFDYLSKKAKENLYIFYSKDYDCLDLLKKWNTFLEY